MVRSTKLQSLDNVNSEDLPSETTSPTSDSYSYTVPGSSGTMKETHIFTPITSKSVVNIIGTATLSCPNAGTTVTTNTTEPITPSLIPNGISNQLNPLTCDEDPLQNDAIVIKENVVKKEYRDVEYEPSKLVVNASADDFTEFQFVQPAQSMPNSNPVIEQHLNIIHSPSMSFLSDIHDTAGLKSMPNDRHINSFDSLSSIPVSTIDRTISTDVGVKSSSNSGSQSEFDLYATMNKTPSHSHTGNTDNVPNEQFGCGTDPMGIFSIQSTQHYHSLSAFEQPQSTIKLDTQQPNTKQNSNNNNTNSSTVRTNHNNNSRNSVRSNHSNASTYTGGGSNILMPQTANNVQLKQTNANSSAPTIAWPEPGINTDQLEQLEARFSIQPDANMKCNRSDARSTATKNNDQASSSATADDEWSDFVSVVQPQTPITNILNKNLLKHQNNDEDDWSEFVSSTPPPPNSLHHFAPPPQNESLLRINANHITTTTATTNPNYNNVFKPWTTTPFSQKIHHAASYHHNTTSNAYAKSSSNSQRYTKTVNSISNGDSLSHTFQNVMQKSSVAPPSIISLPDLGFVAPKSLINMPSRTLAKK